MFMISFEFHTQNGNVPLTSYSLQEMSTLFRKMSANQVRAVHGFFHVCLVGHFPSTNSGKCFMSEGSLERLK